MIHQYNEIAVEREIERSRRRHRISKKEARLIHALLQGPTIITRQPGA